MEEIEVKFLDIDPEALQDKLKELGATKVGEYFYRRRVFDYPDFRLDKDGSWLRLRDEDGKIFLTFKKRIGMGQGSGGNDLGMEEIQVQVDDFEKTASLVLKLGLIDKHYAEQKRIKWIKDDIQFDIDWHPELAPYLEIEAPSWEDIDKAIVMLGLNPEDKKICSATQIYALKGIKTNDYIRIAFDGLARRDM